MLGNADNSIYQTAAVGKGVVLPDSSKLSDVEIGNVDIELPDNIEGDDKERAESAIKAWFSSI